MQRRLKNYMTSNENTLSFLLTIIGVAITFIIPLPLSDQYRILIISALVIFFIAVVLSQLNKKIDFLEQNNEKIKEKIKIHEQLIDIKADIKMLKERNKK